MQNKNRFFSNSNQVPIVGDIENGVFIANSTTQTQDRRQKILIDALPAAPQGYWPEPVACG